MTAMPNPESELPRTLTPTLWTLNPELWTLNLELWTLNPELWTRDEAGRRVGGLVENIKASDAWISDSDSDDEGAHDHT
jgi:hypothetical protein